MIFRLLLYCLGQEQWTPQDNDFIILVMGMSGAGKSKGRRETATEVGHDLKSCTAKVLPLVINHGPSLGASGCNGDSGRSDAQIRNCINSELLSLWFWIGQAMGCLPSLGLLDRLLSRNVPVISPVKESGHMDIRLFLKTFGFITGQDVLFERLP